MRPPGVCERTVAQEFEGEGRIVYYYEGLPKDAERAYGAVEVLVGEPVVAFEDAGGRQVVYVAEEGEAAGAGWEGEGGFGAEDSVEDECCEEGCDGEDAGSDCGGHGEAGRSIDGKWKGKRHDNDSGFRNGSPCLGTYFRSSICLFCPADGLLRGGLRRLTICSGVVAPTRKERVAYQTKNEIHLSRDACRYHWPRSEFSSFFPSWPCARQGSACRWILGKRKAADRGR